MPSQLMDPSQRCSGRRPHRPSFGGPGPLLLVLLVGCATGGASGSLPRGLSPTSPPAPGQYTLASDTATAGCLRNPACYTTPPGEEAVIPWLSNAASATRTATTMALLLTDAQIKLIEKTLTDCAHAANQQVNQEDEALKGREPDREECRRVVRREGNTDVTRAMELGTKKHDKALDCARKAFEGDLAKYVRVEPTYQKDLNTGLWRWIDPQKLKEWLQLGLTAQLWGALVPDIVIHAAGNPNQVQRVYDFKFPCPPTNTPSWRPYAPDHPHYPKDQGKMYETALLGGKLKPNRVTPKGVQQ